MCDKNMITNYIYLLQEREFIKTNENIYKVGRTKKENYIRFNQYPNGSVLLFQMICNKCENIENQIIKIFKNNFKQIKYAGNEYFEGDYQKMIDIIYSSIKNENNDDIDKINNNINEIDESNNEDFKLKKLNEKIYKIFPDYKNDESFNGLKKFIKINLVNEEYIIKYINPQLTKYIDYYFDDNSESTFEEYIIISHSINKFVFDKLQYFNNLIKKKVISIDNIYDIYSLDFINKIIKTKITLNIQNFTEFYEKYISNLKIYSNIEEKIRQIFYCNMLINNELYAVMENKDNKTNLIKEFNNLKDFDNFTIDIGTNDYIIIQLYKINNNYYEYNYLRKYIPYLIRWDINNNYYIVNRDYDYIGINNNTIEYQKKESVIYLMMIINHGTLKKNILKCIMNIKK